MVVGVDPAQHDRKYGSPDCTGSCDFMEMQSTGGLMRKWPQAWSRK